MKRKTVFLMMTLGLLSVANVNAQVTIGGVSDPVPGALLDLNSSDGLKGGLLLSNVSIANLSKIPIGTKLFPGITSSNNDTNTAFAGAMVYHTGENNIPAGVYIWNGGRWIPPGGDDPSILYDAEMNDYTTGYFGNAGTWTTQNLRTEGKTYPVVGEPIELELNIAPGSSTVPYYTYPGTGDADARKALFEPNQHYGLLYNWAAASGRTDASPGTDSEGFGATPSTNPYRGICPLGWHLPSDYEWSELEQEIARNPDKYSEQKYSYENSNNDAVFFNTTFGWRPDNETVSTYWARQMKSKTRVLDNINPNGVSFSCENGGFDALLVGIVYGNGGSSSYGQAVDFWSSTSCNSDGVSRHLYYANTSLFRNQTTRVNLYSVRCKKN